MSCHIRYILQIAGRIQAEVDKRFGHDERKAGNRCARSHTPNRSTVCVQENELGKITSFQYIVFGGPSSRREKEEGERENIPISLLILEGRKVNKVRGSKQDDQPGSKDCGAWA